VQGPGSPLAKVPILFHLAHRYSVLGDFEQSSIIIRSLQHLAQSKEALPYVLIFTRLAEAMHSQIVGDHEKCLKAVSEGLKTSRHTGIFFLDHELIGQAVSSCQNMGDLGMAQTMLGKMVASWDRFPLYVKGLYHFLQTRQYLLRSEFEAATRQVKLGLKTATESGFYLGLGLTYLLAAQVMHKVGKQQAAWNYLREAFRIAERFKSKLFEYYGLMIEAHFHFEERDEASGLVSLRKALALGKERGFLNTLVDQPVVTARLCVKALEEGIEVPYVQEIIRKRRLIPEKPPLHLENWPWPLKIFTLGRFGLLRDGKPIEFSKKIQEKPLSLVKILIALGGREVKEEDVADLLWPEADGDLAQHSFEMTLHRLRTLVGYPDAFQLQDGRLIMEQRYCWVDVWAFERLLGEADARRKEGVTEKAAELTHKAIKMYRGPFLVGEMEQLLVTSFRERLRSKFLRNVSWLGGYSEEANKWEEALECYQRGLEVDDLAEELYRRLMLCHQRLGQKAEALSAYKRCEKILKDTLGIEPSPETRAVYKTLL
jgi:DNA-binding SARP family transcriptional activator